MQIKSVAVLGAGAVGSYVIWGLSSCKDIRLAVIAEGPRAERLKQQGITINGTTYRPQVWTPQEANGVDLLVVALKYGALPGALDSIAAAVDPNTTVMSLMNGVDSEEIIAAQIGAEHVLPSLIKVASHKEADGYHFNPETTIGIIYGELAAPLKSERVQAVEALLAGTGIGFKNFLRLFQDEVFLKSLAITLKYVLISVPLKLTFALLVAYLLTRPSRMVTFYRSLYYLPSLVGGSVAVALVWKQLFARKGLFNSVLANMDMSTINWFGNQKLALYPLILMSVWQFGSSMIIFAAGLKEIPVSYYEAARIDGARGYQSFFRITLPCLSPIILYNLIMQTISAFMAFTQAMIITNGGPNNSTMLYALYVYNQAFKYNDMGYACAMSWFMLVVMGLITFIIFKTSKFWVFSEAN